MTFTIRSALAYDLALLLFRPLHRQDSRNSVERIEAMGKGCFAWSSHSVEDAGWSFRSVWLKSRPLKSSGALATAATA